MVLIHTTSHVFKVCAHFLVKIRPAQLLATSMHQESKESHFQISGMLVSLYLCHLTISAVVQNNFLYIDHHLFWVYDLIKVTNYARYFTGNMYIESYCTLCKKLPGKLRTDLEIRLYLGINFLHRHTCMIYELFILIYIQWDSMEPCQPWI